MRGLVSRIQLKNKAWIAGTSPAMTTERWFDSSGTRTSSRCGDRGHKKPPGLLRAAMVRPQRSRPRGDMWGFIPALAVPLRTDELASAAQPLFVTIVCKFLSTSNKFVAVRLPASEPA